MRKIFPAIVAVTVLTGAPIVRADNSEKQKVGSTASATPVATPEHRADSSAKNSEQRASSKGEREQLTAEDQSSNEKAIELTRSIRQQVVERDDFSVYAKNVKIITNDAGTVTLKGPVRSVAEREEIERIAKSVAGAKKVKNQIEVAKSTESAEEGEQHG